MRLKPNKFYIIFALLLGMVGLGVWIMVGHQAEALALAKNSIDTLRLWQQQHPALFALGYATAYIFCLLVFLPVDTIFMLLAGAIFTLPVAALLACTVHTTGTMTTFFISRYLLDRGRAENHNSTPAIAPTRRQKWNAWLTLVLLRIAPLIPTHAISMVMANAPITPRGFYAATWFGSMPLTLCMVFIGQKLATLENLEDVMTPQLIFGLMLLMIVLAFTKVMVSKYVKL